MTRIASLVARLRAGGREAGAPLHAGAMYFGYYMALGALIPYINLYYERIGLSGVQIGALAALPVLVGVLAALLWSGAADAFHWHRGILKVALLGVCAAILALSRAQGYAALALIVAVYAVFNSPIVPLLDSAALEVAQEKRHTYGAMRVGGTIGWAISTWLMGTLIERFNIHLMFTGYVVFMGLTFVLSWAQPQRRQMLRISLYQGLRRLLLRRDFLIFLASAFLVGMTIGTMNTFYSLYMDGIGAGEGLIGLAWTVAALSEAPMMLYSGRIIRRISASGLLKIAFVTYAVRWLLLSFIYNPVLALVVQLLHGLSFGALLTGGVTYVSERTPEGLGTTAQAVFTTVAFGLASIAGSLAGGSFYDSVGMMVLFRIMSVVALAGLALFWTLDRVEAVSKG